MLNGGLYCAVKKHLLNVVNQYKIWYDKMSTRRTTYKHTDGVKS